MANKFVFFFHSFVIYPGERVDEGETEQHR